jgi:hypothetical protein
VAWDPVAHVKVGDTVLATDPQTGVTAPEKVQNVIVTTTDKDFTTLTLDTAPVRGPPQKAKADAGSASQRPGTTPSGTSPTTAGPTPTT